MTALNSLLRRRLESRASAMPILAAETRSHEAGPVSHAQEYLWFTHQFNETNGALNRSITISFDGSLKIPVLRDALSNVVARHDVLRAVFSNGENGLRQAVKPAKPVALPLVDLKKRKQSRGRLEKAACRQMRTETERPFNLETGPLFRVVLYRIAENRHLFHVVVHHLVSDGWSDGIFLRDLAAEYRGLLVGEQVKHPAMSIQYVDFASWERSAQPIARDRDRQYWLKTLTDAPAGLRLPFVSDVSSEYDGRKFVSVLPRELVENLRRVGRQADATLFMTLLAVFQTLLHRYTGARDIIVGAPVANRPHRDTRELMGPFVNTVAIRTKFEEGATFDELLARVREQALGAFAHQELAFSEVLKLRGEGDATLFSTMVQLRNAPQPVADFGDLRTRIFELDDKDPDHARLRVGPVSMVDLVLDCVERETGMVCCFEYNYAVLSEETVARIAKHFKTLLEAVVENPGFPIGDLKLMTEAETEDTVSGWRCSTETAPPELSVVEMFDAQAIATPHAIAVIDGAGSVTYDELKTRSDNLAIRLESSNVGHGHIVGLCVSRSIDMVVGVLGILRSGAAYLPMDPSYPDRRLEFMVMDAGPDALVSVSAFELGWIGKSNPSRVRINLDDGGQREHDSSDFESPRATDLAYVMYTSGSTGQPKGVMVEHGALSNLTQWAREEYELDDADRVLQFASMSFDSSVEEIFPTLLAGATLVLRNGEMLASPADFFGACASFGVSVLNLPTAYWHELTQSFSEHDQVPDHLRLVIVGGEPVSSGLLEEWNRRIGPNVRVVNTYGPTEGTVVATACDIAGRRSVATPGGLIPIGTPIANAKAYVLDSRMRPVPNGVVGELYLAGIGVARGYLGQPELTAKQFQPDPFGGVDGDRMYRTGDLVRYRDDGLLEFRGRMDRQIKLRGHRIELGEIEQVLERHIGVRKALAVLRAVATGSVELVGYVIPAPGSTLTDRSLRDFLHARLPDHMVPQRFAGLSRFPISRQGKVDVESLPDPSACALELGGHYVELETQTQETVAEIWSEVLGIDRVGARDDLFDLGGHSLLATRIVTRLRESFDVPLSLRAVFQHRTVETLASHLDGLVELREHADHQAVGTLRPLAPAFHNGKPPLSFAQRRVWYLDQLQPDSPAYNIAFAFALKGPLVVPVLEQCIVEIVRRHEVLRSKFVLVDDAPAQIGDPTVRFRLCTIDVSNDEYPLQETRKHLTHDASQPFDLAVGPVFRARLYRLADDKHVLAFVVHHIAVDGWSVDVLLRELDVLYKSFVHGRRSPLERPVLQYSDFAVWQAQWPGSEWFERQLDYWRQKLGGELPIVELPTDRVRPTVQRHHGSTVTCDDSVELSNRLDNVAREHDVTVFMVLLAAFKCLLQRYTGLDDLLVGTPIANRTRPELENIIGFFSNTLVLRTDLAATTRFSEVVERVRSVCLEAYDNQDVPFEHIVEELRPNRDLSRSPIFQVMLAYQETSDRSGRIGDLLVERFEYSTSISRFDLYVWVHRSRNGLRVTLEYDADLFDAKTIRRMSEHYTTMLHTVADDFDVRLSSIRLLSHEEHTHLIHGVNDTASTIEPCGIYDLFARQAADHPDKIAVECGDRSFTYAELGARAQVVARYLGAIGVGSEYLVGIALERSVDVVVAVLGVLRSGAAYLPLDPDYPTPRLDLMIREAGVSCVLTESSQRDRIVELMSTNPSVADLNVVCLDTDWPTIEGCADHALTCQPEGGSLAYVMYTSGSTGSPKGVEVQHDAVVNLLEAMKREPGIDSQDVLFAVSPFSFDISVLELLLPLVAGARVVICTHDVVRDGVALAQAMSQAGTTIMQATPATWRALIATGWQPRSKIKILCGGETLPADLATALLTQAAGVWNLYGPTETTIWSTCQRIVESDAVTVGYPIANTRAYILDSHLQPVPVGVTGELFVAGAGVARGYRGRPDLTTERFVPDPFVGNGNDRMYRTGDLARRRHDGSIALQGRIDRQVKVRGHRIELGEVESTLMMHQGIEQCAVSLHEVNSGDRRLVAYVVYANGQHFTSTELRRYMRTIVPDFMIPQHFVSLQRLPLTKNGKLDWSQLPAPFESSSDPTPFDAPAGQTENKIADIWMDTLGTTRVGRDANFFELGGHSLLSINVVSKIGQELGCHISPRNLVLETLAQIASECDRQRNAIAVREPKRPGVLEKALRGLQRSWRRR